MDEKLRDLEKQERFLYATFNRVSDFVDNFDEATHAGQVGVRMQRLDQAFEKLLDVRKKIELLTDDVIEPISEDSEQTYEEREQFLAAAAKAKEEMNMKIVGDIEDDYCDLRAALLALQPSTVPPVDAAAETSSRVKLPEIHLPVFGGKLEEWTTFRDIFQSLMNRNPQLTEIDKFNYLRLSLIDKPLLDIDVSAVNYSVAWSALEKEYGNRKLIVKTHLDLLFAVEPMKTESYEALNHLTSEFDKHLTMMEKIGEKPTNWSTILVHMMCSKLDTDTLQNWEAFHNSKDVPSYESLMTFLRHRCSVPQSVAPSAKPSTAADEHPRNKASCPSNKSSIDCPVCSEPFHYAFQCLKFLKMRAYTRFEVVRQHGFCYNCLSPGHQAKNCTRGSCHHCQQRHHSLLHPESSDPFAQNRSSAVDRQKSQTPPSPTTPNHH